MEAEGIDGGLPVIFWEGREPDAAKETEAKGGRPTKYEFKDYRKLFPTHDTLGLELSPLHKRLEVNRPIDKKTLHSALKRWVSEGLVELVEGERGNRYRLSKFMSSDNV